LADWPEVDMSDKPNPVKQAIESEDVIKIYANGFTSFFSNSDVRIVFSQNNKQVVLLNMSLTLAKTLLMKLGQMVHDFEKNTDVKILTTSDIEEKFLKKMQKDAELQ
jgi:Leu/Phe-tRNA-protein transferase